MLGGRLVPLPLKLYEEAHQRGGGVACIVSPQYGTSPSSLDGQGPLLLPDFWAQGAPRPRWPGALSLTVLLCLLVAMLSLQEPGSLVAHSLKWKDLPGGSPE